MTNIHISTASVNDVATVRLGGMSPALPVIDTAKVRLGGMRPALPVIDTAKMRLAA